MFISPGDEFGVGTNTAESIAAPEVDGTMTIAVRTAARSAITARIFLGMRVNSIVWGSALRPDDSRIGTRKQGAEDAPPLGNCAMMTATMSRRASASIAITIATTIALGLASAACSSSSGGSASPTSADSSPTTAASTFGIVNTWVGKPADTTKLPIGTSKVSLSGPAVGGLYACDAGNARGDGAFAVGPWIDEAAGTWNLSKKVSVQGAVSWPMANYSETIEGTTRRITSNGLPVGEVTGTFPIASNDPAYSYDRNPNRIAANDVTVSLPATPRVAAAPKCLGKGRVGVLKNGVSMFASLDEPNRDAVAYETQDECDGHPQQTSVYHYHDVPSCI